jgi:hypothetical protein
MCNGVCNFLDTEFPLDERLLDKMYSMMTEKIIKTYFYFNRDINKLNPIYNDLVEIYCFVPKCERIFIPYNLSLNYLIEC